MTAPLRRILTTVIAIAAVAAPGVARADNEDLEAVLEQSVVTTASQTAERVVGLQYVWGQ